MLANFYAQTTLAIASVCAVNASNLLLYAQCMLANWYRMHSTVYLAIRSRMRNVR